MSQGSALQYPITSFLLKLMEDRGLSPSDFVISLGYRNLERGLARLNLWLDGDGNQKIIEQIIKAYPSSAEELLDAIAATRQARALEAQAAFVERCRAEAHWFTPYVHADGEHRVPSSICIFGVSGGKWNLIQIPKNILNFTLEEQRLLLPELMRSYRKRFKGQVPFFGRLTGFKFVRLLDYFRFDANGHYLEHVKEPFRRGTCSVELR